MTVSRVLNGGANVREAKRQAVNTAIGALSYAPNPAARSLAAGHLVRLGLPYSNPSAAYLSEFLVGSLDQCRRLHIQLAVEQCDSSGDEAAAVRELVAAGVDGVLLPPPLCDSEAVLQVLTKSVTPAVAVATGRARQDISTVRIDDFVAAQAVTNHLLSLGHRRIGFIKGHPNQAASGERLRAYLAAMKAARIAPEPNLIVEGLFTYRSGLQGAARLLDLDLAPTAVFASNDDMAAAVVAVAHQRGLDVPRDLSVCGFDDSAAATMIWPELTTIRQPIAQMARQAVVILADQIRAARRGAAVRHVDLLLPHTLIQRQSDAPRTAAVDV
jgi:LacI family transcriptional regulator